MFMKIKLFNKLPQEAWAVTLNKFKTVLRTWLKAKAFYSVDDYFACDVSTLSFI